MNDVDQELETLLLDEIRLIQAEYQKAIKPYVDKITQIRSRWSPEPFQFAQLQQVIVEERGR